MQRNSFLEVRYQFPKPINFDEKNQEFEIFKSFPDENCAEPRISFLRNVRIATNSVVFRYFKVFRESCIGEENYRKYSSFKFYLKFIFPAFNFSKKKFLLITDEWTSNYYHWHAYALKRLLSFQSQNLLKNSLIFLPKKYKNYSFVMPSLKAFGVNENQVVFLRRKSNLKVSELAICSIPSHHPQIYREIRETLTNKIDVHDFNLNFGDKIYISRARMVLRFVENEQEVLELLEKYGFRKLIMEDYSYEQQVQICKKAKYLVAPHGAGITNAMFMSDDSALLELRNPSEKNTRWNQDYYALSTMLGIRYFYQECDFGEKSHRKDFHHGSLLVDLIKLEKNLQLMLQK